MQTNFMSETENSLKEAMSNVDFGDMPTKNVDDLFSADIDYMNNYLKSLPDYSKITNSNSSQPSKSYTTTNVKLREHPTPKPFYSTSTSTTADIGDLRNSRNNISHKGSVPQSPINKRKEINPLSKSYSIHSFSKRNINQSIEKETIDDQPQQQKNKISRSTSSSTIPVKDSHSTNDLMGFVRKPSSLMNIFKKLGSQNPPSQPPSSNNNNNSNNNANNNNSSTATKISTNVHQQSTNSRKNANDTNVAKTTKTKSISDFWKDNLQQQNHSSNNKFGWNYHKIMSNLNQKSPSTAASNETLQKPNPPSSHISQEVQKPQLNLQNSQNPLNSSSNISLKKDEPVEAIEPVIQNFINIIQNETKSSPPKQTNSNSNNNNIFKPRNNTQQFLQQQQQQHHNQHIPPFHGHYGKAQSIHSFVKKMTDSPKLQRSPRMPIFSGESEHEQKKLLKSSSNSHVYLMNKDDPNYLKNLHKITKSLDNATNNLNQTKYKRSISNSSVPSFMASSPQQAQFYYPPHHSVHPSGAVMVVHPTSAPVSFYPQMPPSSYNSQSDFHMSQIQRNGSKSNIPVFYKCNPLNKSSSNASMMTNYNGSQQQVAPIGFYNVQDPLMCWKQQQQSSTAAVPMHLVNKSSSSSCIYAKTLSQPTHLAKNYDIFAKYKPIVSDDEDSESDDEDESKHSNISKGSSYVSINKMSGILPAPPVVPFMRPSYHEKQKSGNYSNQYPPPFTKLNSIPIPINGQLPSAFKKSNNNNCDSIAKSSMNDVVVGEASRKNSLNSNSNSNRMTQQQVMKYSCNSSSRDSDNIFFNFLNPMAATKPEMHFQQQETSSNESVGCSYTPYTKYLSDRKYFDVAAMSDVNGTNNHKPEQRRSSKIPILSSTTTTTQADQLQNLNISSSSEHIIIPDGGDVMLQEHSDVVVEGCDESKVVDKKTEEFQLENVANVEPTNLNTNANLKNETFVVDPKEILSAFDPYFIDDTKQQQITEPSSNNKLHKLLSAVTSEWNSNNCDIVIPPPSTSYTSHKNLLTKCKSFQSTPHFGSCQYEVDEFSFNFYLKFFFSFRLKLTILMQVLCVLIIFPQK